jgi:hypothetical protein
MKTSLTTPRDWHVGQHHIRFEPPDILWVNLQGNVTLEEVKKIVELSREQGEQRPFYIAADLSKVETVDGAARQHASKEIRPEWFAGVVYIGASFVTKAAAKGLALVLYFTGKMEAPIDFVHTESEGRDHINKLRAKKKAAQIA